MDSGTLTYKFLFPLHCGQLISVKPRKVARLRARRAQSDEHRPIFIADKIIACMKEIERHSGHRAQCHRDKDLRSFSYPGHSSSVVKPTCICCFRVACNWARSRASVALSQQLGKQHLMIWRVVPRLPCSSAAGRDSETAKT